MLKRRRCFVLGGVVLVFCLFIYYPIQQLVEPDETDVWTGFSRDMTVFVHPRNYTVKIEASKVCNNFNENVESGNRRQGEDVFLLVVVCSAANNYETRMAIRETWGRPGALEAEPRDFPSSESSDNYTARSLTSPGNDVASSAPIAAASKKSDNDTAVRLMFMLGRTENDSVQLQIIDEASKHGDVVQEDFLDTYNNLTIKSVMMLKWVNATCRGARYVMKTDDDTFVNVPRLVAYLRKNGHRSLLLGCLICSAMPVKDKTSKWYTPNTLFTERVYPNYLSGTGYVISGDLVPRLYDAALATPFFHLEDIFVTGLCARRLRVKPQDYEGFTYQKRPLNPCLYHMAITGHKVSAVDTRFVWKEMHDEGLQCNNASQIKLRSFKPSKCF